jgi:hypothetical protein
MRTFFGGLALAMLLLWSQVPLFAEFTFSFQFGLAVLVNDELTFTVVEEDTGVTTTATRRAGSHQLPSGGIGFGYWFNGLPFLGLAVDSCVTLLEGEDIVLDILETILWIQFRVRLGSDPSFAFGRYHVIGAVGLNSGSVGASVDLTREGSRDFELSNVEMDPAVVFRIGADWFPRPTRAVFGNMSVLFNCRIGQMIEDVGGPWGRSFGWGFFSQEGEWTLEANAVGILGQLGLEFHRRPRAIREHRRLRRRESQ